jgi:hypothetical protein
MSLPDDPTASRCKCRYAENAPGTHKGAQTGRGRQGDAQFASPPGQPWNWYARNRPEGVPSN